MSIAISQAVVPRVPIKLGASPRKTLFQLVKVNPLANSTKQQIWAMIMKYDIPYNPLHDQGYQSIGCWPCTQPTLLEDERAGRWSGMAKTECGLHSLDDAK